MTVPSPQTYAALEAELAAVRSALAARDAELEEARVHQAATAEILQVISRSPTDVKPVFEAIAERAAVLCKATSASSLRFDGELIHLVGLSGMSREGEDALRAIFPRKADRSLIVGRVVLERKAQHVPDVQADTELTFQHTAETAGIRSLLAVPMLREDEVVGVIGVTRGEPGMFPEPLVKLLQIFADQAVIAIENARLFRETQEALERQTATAEILQVINNSPTDVKPVFEAIAERATVLCKASVGMTSRFDGELIHMIGISGASPEGENSVRAGFPRTPDNTYAHGRAVLARALVHVPDLLADPETLPHKETYRKAGIRSALAVPMLRDGEVVGVIGVSRGEPGMFPEPLVKLLQTFADQAVIAIENVRLVNETREALEQQTATAEVLKVISSSVAKAQPVFEKILDSCHTLFDVENMAIALLDNDGQLHLGAGRGVAMEVASKFLPRPLEGTTTARAILERRIIYTPNVSAASESYTPFLRSITGLIGNSSGLVAPLLLDGHGIGSIWLARVPPKPFSDKEIALLTTFADQAVIAIENARMFRETQEALERQTATAEVLQVISSSPTTTQPVFEAIAERAVAISGYDFCNISSYDGEFMRLEASVGMMAEDLAELRSSFKGRQQDASLRPSRGSAIGRALLTGSLVKIPDHLRDPEFEHSDARVLHRFRSLVAVPLIRNGRTIGGMTLGRAEPGDVPDKIVRLLQTFADQAVIAIENVSLFESTQKALEQQTATSDVLQVISTSMADSQPVFEKILDSAEKLIAGNIHILHQVQEGQTHVVAQRGGAAAQRLSDCYPIPVEHTSYSLGEPDAPTIYVTDTSALEDPPLIVQRGLEAIGAASFITAKLRWEGQWIGSLTVLRVPPRPFSDQERTLLRTFADQAVIAFQNTKLFNDTKEALEQQTAISDVLRVTTESPSDVDPVLNAIADHAVRLCAAAAASIFLVEGDQLRHVCSRGALAEQAVELNLLPIDRASTSGVAILEGVTIEVADIQAETAKYPLGAETARRLGHRSMAVTPLLREGKAFGTLLIRRQEMRPFSAREVALLKTFGSQAAIALQNVRLFRETKEALEYQTATGEILKVISSSMADTQPVFEKILDSCEQLFDAQELNIFMASNDRFHLAGWRGRWMEFAKIGFPLPIDDVLSGLPFRERRTLHIPSVGGLKTIPVGARGLVEQLGDFSTAIAPMLWEGRAVGTIGVIRHPPKPFTDKELTLLSTFADQAVIAIENARLFREIEDKSRQLEEASKHKSQFLASMSHELRTPLNAILGFNEMILDEIYGDVPTDMREPLRDIQDSGKHLLRLINNVLDLAKIEAGRMELALGDYAVHDLVESVRATLRPLASAKGLEFVTTVPDELPLAYGDFGRLTQCLMNLAGNSLKFTSVGRVELSIELQGSTLVFRVADTGIGIPADKIDSLFTEFKQTDATIASEYGGTGLGLSISRKFVEMHGGRIWVESEVGRGSVFNFEVPLRVEPAVA
ncbi:MAG: GAF domain-containing protein [Gammaproteobacteria bacterium]|nr:GAF domain-containing protein [Gammaproteobacteria bacterium]